MFSTLPLLAHNLSQASYYAPQISSPLSSSPLRPSPLSLRHENAPPSPRRRLLMSSPTPTKNLKEKPYSQRVTRSNPLIHNRGDGRETRRKLFLKKVREDSEEKRWDARGGEDEMMRTIWIAEEKRRAERQAMEASYVPASHEEEELEVDKPDITLSSPGQSKDEEMVDAVAQQEEAEIEALLSMMETENKPDHPEPYERPETPYGSDDEEYDRIFLDVIKEETMSDNRQQQDADIVKTNPDMMDMS